MEAKELKIQVPKGYEIDKVNSTSNYIKFKPIKKDITYGDVCEKIFEDNGFYTSSTGRIEEMVSASWNDDKNNATNKKQLRRLLALNQLLNIAEYYNAEVEISDSLYTISYNVITCTYEVISNSEIISGVHAYFYAKEDAQTVMDNPNFREILDTIYKD